MCSMSQPAAGLLMHTARGSQYGADSYRQLLTQHGIQPSMSRKGTCWDNAVAESFLHTLKTALIYTENRTHTRQPRQRYLSILRCSITASAVIQRMAISLHCSMSKP